MKIKSKSRRNQRLCPNQVAIVSRVTFFAAMAARSAEISGTAYASDSNKGELGVGVTLSRSGVSHPNPKRQFTREDGNYSFKNLAPGKYRLDFKKVGFTIVVPYKESIELSSNSTAKEPVRAYSRATNIDPERVAVFLKERAGGDNKRLLADIMALHETKTFDPSTVDVIKLALNQLATTAGTIASVKSESRTFVIIPKHSATPFEYTYTGSTIVLDPSGRTLGVDQLPRHGLSPDVTAKILYKKNSWGLSTASKIILESNMAAEY